MHSGQQAKTCFSANLTAKIMQITRRTKEFVHFFALELLIRVFLRILYSNLLPIYKSNTETQLLCLQLLTPRLLAGPFK